MRHPSLAAPIRLLMLPLAALLLQAGCGDSTGHRRTASADACDELDGRHRGDYARDQEFASRGGGPPPGGGTGAAFGALAKTLLYGASCGASR